MVKVRQHSGPTRDQLRRAFGATLRTLRLRIGYAQERFAYEAEIDRSYFGKLERGGCTPTLETIYRFLPLLQITFLQFAEEFERSLRKERRKPEGPTD